ncbi:tRNA (adenosine(37)-N6)-threonylcarbamoyltransferase complex ATPase subunit type 1 TsaE [Wenyingzhuangia aestuarii]|uniref:tRNA (adenosine(37)-N6)-threonylcarbamoyltransferase complex ATPase subunit type 1 TsaE n=1 Tax=Wenyingzhuangia aestuarii TaxID=1647582 RepID=UPI00143A84E4|nr:tRNA (adenosine(37)-N6)-threonylcarbamoyltransferase complex ATPase subunit type 1 TsaE [Wenyingzhuangia aestuarii]NJB82565.1 tRNA threonylcarbamoyladenosine biosynthesis protein TsaE [Wenyingzhuangia aestuarii]
MEITYSLKDLSAVASAILKNTKSKTLLFYATMGTGKTTLIKELANQLGCSISSSPTFALVNEYETDQNEILYHFDFYRVEDENEAYDIGIEEYLYNNQWAFIEWPENVENLLPLDAQVITIKTNADDSRTICLK